MSGKTARRQRRLPPATLTPPGSRRRAPRGLLVAAAVVLVGVGVGIAVALGGGGGSTSATNVPAVGSLANGLPGADKVYRLLRGIPQHGNVLGNANAPVTMVEYVDLQCPYCREFETTVLPDLVSNDIRPGKVKLELRLLAFIGSDSERGRAAAIAAGRQAKLFDFAELLYFNQGTENTGWLSDAMVVNTAASIPGLEVPMMLAARKHVSTEEGAFAAQAQADDVSSTPTVFVGRSGGTLRRVTLASPTDGAAVNGAIRAASA